MNDEPIEPAATPSCGPRRRPAPMWAAGSPGTSSSFRSPSPRLGRPARQHRHRAGAALCRRQRPALRLARLGASRRPWAPRGTGPAVPGRRARPRRRCPPDSRCAASPVDAAPCHRRGDVLDPIAVNLLKGMSTAIARSPCSRSAAASLRGRAGRPVLGDVAAQRRPLLAERPCGRRPCAALALLRRLGRRATRLALAWTGDRRRRGLPSSASSE